MINTKSFIFYSHYYLLAICGLVSTSEEMDVISMSFILPSAQCDLDLDTQVFPIHVDDLS